MTSTAEAQQQPLLVDTHCHLTYPELGEPAWQRAREAGVTRAIVIGIDRQNCQEALDFVAEREGLFCALGIHPNATARAEPGDFEAIAALCRHPDVVAVGESGLDFYWQDAPSSVQAEFLERHAELALELDLPLVLHIRDAYPAAAEQLASWAARGLRGVIHCFGGQEDEVFPFVDWGWPVSFSGILTYKKAENIRAAAERVPLAQCLVETDAPYLPPAPHRGKSNEPAFVRHTAAMLAQVKGVTLDEMARITSENAERVFRLPKL